MRSVEVKINVDLHTKFSTVFQFTSTWWNTGPRQEIAMVATKFCIPVCKNVVFRTV